MMNTVSFTNGVIFDTRSILISVSGLFLGYLPTVVATLMISVYRIYLGGSGAMTGVLVTVTSAAIGLLWYRYRMPTLLKKINKVWLELYLFGVLVRTGGDEFVMLLPQTSYRQAGTLVETIKKACETGYKLDDELIITSISLGFATKTKEHESFEKVFKLAEESMYRKKLLEYKSFHSAVMNSIKTTLFEKSNETEEHAERMANLAKRLGQVLGLDQEELVSLELVATLHDIGKISIDSKLLMKNSPLTEGEWDEIKKHPEVGYRIAQTVPELRKISEYILCHYERWDGNGYPQGLKAEEIPLLARILAIVDAYDGMTQDRSYRNAMSEQEAIVELKRHAGSQFDLALVAMFIKRVIEKNDSTPASNVDD